MSLKELNLKEFLEHKTLYYDKIDYSYIKKSADILLSHIKLPFTIHIVGTNGKGSTGRFLAFYLYKNGYKTLHYSSPHIKEFNERIWLNGADISNESLEIAHKFLQNIYDIELLEKLTYFEYTTLLAFFISKDCDYLVLEAGLGGEFDATNVVKNDLSLVTTIGLDHISFLGDTLEKIARTKMRSVDTNMIIGFQEFDEVYETALKVKDELKKEFNRNIEILKVEDFKIDYEFTFANYLKRNLSLVLKALDELNIDINLEIFNQTPLFGRCQKIGNNLTIDVGHNPLAAKVLLKEFENKKINLIYNSYADKDYKEVLTILKPIIKSIFIIDLEDKRIVEKEKLIEVITNLNLEIKSSFEIKEDEEYLAFGSFLVVEKVLELQGS
ncbi:bifunctional folylpolyglutamate synthase/dihydrofolate synthase [Arcobacter vandammei]|uniref:bifunctional folylpolyglutamate synthase/dihydrofolate synthase n=1 Tax=Arcobacter vandammei TaxID=2782243 RepID=UPI0018DF7A2D|nr:Mur ligase family protein [Arcobacter vandammei]